MAAETHAAAPAPEMAAAPAAADVPAGAPQGMNSASLYVGDLHHKVDESHLYHAFNAIGAVASIRVCRDAITRRSLGYAYVNFQNPGDAERAINELNCEPLMDRPMRVMWSQRDPTLRKSGAGNVFIKNLDKTIDNKTLLDTFSQFGDILSCKVVTDEAGQSKGFGFVHFKNPEDADKAIEQVNNMKLGENVVFVAKFLTKKERQGTDGAQRKFTNVFVKNLPEDYSEDKLKELFAKFGEITSCVIMADDGKSKGFGFVNFAEPDVAAAAVAEMNEKEVDGKVLYCGRAQKRSERTAQLNAEFERKRKERDSKYQGVNLYVKNLDDTIDDDKLREAFQDFGTITSAKVMRDPKGVSRGFGFVCFSSPDEATKAVTEMNTRILGTKPLYVALAQRKADRQSQLAQAHAQRIAGMRQMMQQNFMPQQPMFYSQGGMPMPYRAYPPSMPPNRWARSGGASVGVGMRPGAPSARGGRGNRARGGAVAGGRQQTAKFNAQARNQQQQMAPVASGAAPTPAQPQQPMQGQPITADYLASLTEPQQKQTLGEQLYPRIFSAYGELAGKITGMLLEMDNSELLHMLEDPNALTEKAKEAHDVYQQHVQQE